MSNLPSNSVLSQTPVAADKSPVEKLLGSLRFNKVAAELVDNHGPEGGKAILVCIPKEVLDHFTGTPEDEEFCRTFMRSMLFPFQEMLKLVEDKTIVGFALAPAGMQIGDLHPHQRCEFIGRTLQSLANGEITLS